MKFRQIQKPGYIWNWNKGSESVTDFSIKKAKKRQGHKSEVRTENHRVAQGEQEEDSCGLQMVKIMLPSQMSDYTEPGLQET